MRGNPFATFQQSSFVSSVLPVSISFFFFLHADVKTFRLPSSFFTPSYEMICSIDSHNPKRLISCRPTTQFSAGKPIWIWHLTMGRGSIRSSSAGDLIDEWMSWLCTVRFLRPSLLFVKTQQSRHRHISPTPCPLVAWRHHQSSAVPFEFLLSSCCSVLVLISTNDLPKQTTTYLQSLLSAAESLSTYIAC